MTFLDDLGQLPDPFPASLFPAGEPRVSYLPLGSQTLVLGLESAIKLVPWVGAIREPAAQSAAQDLGSGNR